MICPRCNGEKGNTVLVKFEGDRPCEWRVIPCGMCKGTGEITQEHYERYQKGQAMRADRLKRDLSQSEEAKRLGMTPYAYSRLEQGD